MQSYDYSSRDTQPYSETSDPPASAEVPTPAGLLAELHRQQADHPIWQCRLLRAIAVGSLTRDDLRFVFTQYHAYSSAFTRYIAAVMANCDNDLFRAELSQNLWDEGGGTEPHLRHAQLFRTFLRDGLEVEPPPASTAEDFTKYFVAEYLSFCLKANATAGSAFLSLGTEGIVARLYRVFIEGLRRSGIAEPHLAFFHVHVEHDDDHALTLERMMLSYAREPGWFDTCQKAMAHALDLRASFFDNLYGAIQARRLTSTVRRIQDRVSLLAAEPHAHTLVHRPGTEEDLLYANVNERLNIDFTVTNLPFRPEVLDPRIVRIPPGKCNERHKHAHETLYYVIEGRAMTAIDSTVVELGPGDTAFIPRWAMHQTQNVGNDDVVLLALTDSRLTERVLIGAHNPRLKRVDSDGG